MWRLSGRTFLMAPRDQQRIRRVVISHTELDPPPDINLVNTVAPLNNHYPVFSLQMGSYSIIVSESRSPLMLADTRLRGPFGLVRSSITYVHAQTLVVVEPTALSLSSIYPRSDEFIVAPSTHRYGS